MAKTYQQIEQELESLRLSYENGDILEPAYKKQQAELHKQMKESVVQDGMAVVNRRKKVEERQKEILGMASEMAEKIFPENPKNKAFLMTITTQMNNHLADLIKARLEATPNMEWDDAYDATLLAISEKQVEQIKNAVIEDLSDGEEKGAKAKANPKEDASAGEKQTPKPEKKDIRAEHAADAAEVAQNPRMGNEGTKQTSTDADNAGLEKTVTDWVNACRDDPEHFNDVQALGEVVSALDKMNMDEGNPTSMLLQGHDGTLRTPDHAA